MNRLSLFVFSMIVVSFASPAYATIINYETGANSVNMGTVLEGQEGKIVTNDGKTSYSPYYNLTYIDTVSGYLPAHMKITFSYTMDMSFDNSDAYIGANGIYQGVFQGTGYSSYFEAKNYFQPSIPDYVYRDLYGLVLISSSFQDSQHGILEFVNNSDYSTYFYGLLSTGVSGTGQAYYSVSPVPLPGSLPLISMAFSGLGIIGYRRAKKKTDKNTEALN